MSWQISDSPLGNCATCRNPHPLQAGGRPAWWEAQEGLGRGAQQQALAHGLALSSAPTEVGGREGGKPPSLLTGFSVNSQAAMLQWSCFHCCCDCCLETGNQTLQSIFKPARDLCLWEYGILQKNVKSDRRSGYMYLCNLYITAVSFMHGLGSCLQNASLPNPVCVSRTFCKPHMSMKFLKVSLTAVSYNV